MSTRQAPLTLVPAAAAHGEHPTTAIGPSGLEPVDACPLLDHRTRESLIAPATAPAGRYLGFNHLGQVLLLALTRPITHVGRGLIADVRLEDPRVSRRHAIIALRGRSVRVLDDRSANGTFVNGLRITVAELSDGDVVRFGPAIACYVEVAPVRGDVRRWRQNGSRPARRGSWPGTRGPGPSSVSGF
ncbi:MAG: FHA domain-containing protein [Solirubrobacteraceae bacterium]